MKKIIIYKTKKNYTKIIRLTLIQLYNFLQHAFNTASLASKSNVRLSSELKSGKIHLVKALSTHSIRKAFQSCTFLLNSS